MICGLLGEKLGHSYSPAIHKELANYDYALFKKSPSDVEDFLRNGDFHGLNVTIPYKKSVIPFCQVLTPQAEKLGAVNTIVRKKDGTLLGHNTDYYGFRSMALKSGLNFSGKKALVLGSGGASNTVCAVMQELGANVIVISRNGDNHYNNLDLHTDTSVIINATPVGMYPNNGVSAVDLSIFPKLELVMDLIYNPAKTKLLLDAEKRNIKTENGLWMLIAQAKESAEYFKNQSIDDSVISEIYQKIKSQAENIILIGMLGCGKSTIGKLLSEKLGKQFQDTDSAIEIAAGCNIPDIFQTQGEETFREIEAQVIAEISKKSNLVISTGGGCVTRNENISLLRQNGTIIWLKRSLNLLPTDGRPLSQSQKLTELYKQRQPLYQAASDYIIENSGTPEETVATIIREVIP